MSRFRIVHRGRAASGGSAVTYDSRFGTDTAGAASTGWFTFGLNASSKRIWLDSINGLDSNSGLDAAHPKQTYEAAFRLWSSGFTAGDQLMIAGTGGRTYTDPGSSGGSPALGNATFKSGISLAYPSAVLCYDPASPADTTKYGKLLGHDKPVIQVGSVTGAPSLTHSGDGSSNGDPSPGTDHYIAIQGIAFDAQNTPAELKFTGRHDGVVIQNCSFRTCELSLDNSSSPFGLSLTANVSKCSFYGQWATNGNNSGGFAHGIDGLYRQDNVYVHCGWKLGVTRAEPVATGGAAVFGHGFYYSATSTNGKIDREVFANNAADGFNVRGTAACTQIVSLREPIACNLGGFSTSAHEAPNGVTVTVDDYVVLEGADISTAPDGQRGQGVLNTNTLSGSYLKNAIFADNSQVAPATKKKSLNP